MVSDIEKELKEEEKEVRSEKSPPAGGEMQMEAPKSENPHLRVRPILIFWAIVVVLFAAVLFFVIGMNYGEDKNTLSTQAITDTVTPDDSATATDSASASATADVTADWKTYTNDQNTYSLKYPTDWQIEQAGTSGIAFYTATDEATKKLMEAQQAGTEGPFPQLLIYNYPDLKSADGNNPPKYSSLAEMVADTSNFKDTQTAVFAGVNGYSTIPLGMIDFFAYVLPKDEHIYELMMSNATKASEVSSTVSQVLSTFQFTK